MSEFGERLSTAVNDRIGEVLAEHGGGMTTGYVALIEFLDADGDAAWAFITSDSQTISQTAGMVYALQRLVDREMDEALGDGD